MRIGIFRTIDVEGEKFTIPIRITKNGNDLSFRNKESAMKCIAEIEKKDNVIYPGVLHCKAIALEAEWLRAMTH